MLSTNRRKEKKCQKKEKNFDSSAVVNATLPTRRIQNKYMLLLISAIPFNYPKSEKGAKLTLFKRVGLTLLEKLGCVEATRTRGRKHGAHVHGAPQTAEHAGHRGHTAHTVWGTHCNTTMRKTQPRQCMEFVSYRR